MPPINLFKNSTDTLALAPGEALFGAGDQGEVMYAVVEGEVELTRGGHTLERLGPGEIFGELALIDDAPRNASAVAVVATRVAVVDEREFRYLVQEHPTFALQVMRVMAERLRRTNSQAYGT